MASLNPHTPVLFLAYAHCPTHPPLSAPGQRLVVLSQPSGASPGLPLIGQPSIEVQDPFGNRVVDQPKNVSASLLQASLPSDAPLAGDLSPPLRSIVLSCPSPSLLHMTLFNFDCPPM